MRQNRTHFALALTAALSCSCGINEQPAHDSTGSGMTSSVEEEGATQAHKKSGEPAGTEGFEAVVWFDGDRERTAWIDLHHLVDHAPDAASRAALLTLDPKAEVLEEVEGELRVWRLGTKTMDSREICAAFDAQGARMSPLLRDTPSNTGALRSLPGGVLLSFPKDWSEERAREWAVGRNLEVTQAMQLGGPSLVVDCPAGLSGLVLAGELRADPEVRWAQPNWWVATAAK